MHSRTRRFGVVTVMLICTGLVAAGAGAADLERGEALFDLCAQCHGKDASGNEMYLAPSIAGLSEWYIGAQLRLFQKGGRGTHFDDIAGMRMRPMALPARARFPICSVAGSPGSRFTSCTTPFVGAGPATDTR